ncbi:EpsG family protein [Myroides odoratimimus]|uniref:EpsG family protein n=1 Tax=Myroides odoratimimus TaxID=76832 RepID=UPI0025752236|nr:EpsG family protein [Myroides odoratimimus]MDM1454778.1 EpsG family protein [Myroides odoratimimus]MDM1478499.1 EpsG family protein [Myroides odoratimimus]MDM1490829.1 EpsG family protein [Myroides odoratimimus]
MLENHYEILFNYRYNFLYYIVAFFTSIFVIEFYVKNKLFTKIQYVFLGVLLFILMLLFGTRGVFVGTDTPNNIKFFTKEVQIHSLSDLKDLGIYFISIVINRFTNDIDLFLTVISVLYLMPIFFVIKKIGIKNPMIFFLFLYSLFFFKSMGMNTIRQGLASSYFLLGIVIYLKNRKKMGYLLFVTSFFLHASIIIPIMIFLAALKVKNLKWVIIIYVFSTILSVVNFKINVLLGQIPIINILVEERLDTYYVSNTNYRIGFRPDFWLFNTVFAIIGYFTLKNIDKFEDYFSSNYYKVFYVSYILLSSFFFLMFSASFSDRFGFLSWMFIPLLLMPYAQSSVRVGFLNTLSVFFISVFLFTIFKFI